MEGGRLVLQIGGKWGWWDEGDWIHTRLGYGRLATKTVGRWEVETPTIPVNFEMSGRCCKHAEQRKASVVRARAERGQPSL